MEVEKKFNAAVNVLRSLPKDGNFQPSNEMKLGFYAHFKQATEGPCTQARPGFWDVIGRAKHDAWAKLGNMTKQEAMTEYVNMLTQIIETMNYTADVEQFMEVLGPFYEYVENKISPAHHSAAEVVNGTNLGISRGNGPLEVKSIEEKSLEDKCLDESEEEEEEEEEQLLEDLLGQFNPPEGFNFRNLHPDPQFIKDMRQGLLKEEKVSGTFSRNFYREEKLGNYFKEEKLPRKIISGEQTDQNHNSCTQDKFLDEMESVRAAMESSKNLLKDIHRQKNTECMPSIHQSLKEIPGENDNIQKVAEDITQEEIDRMLERYIPRPNQSENNNPTSANQSSVSAAANQDLVSDAADQNPMSVVANQNSGSAAANQNVSCPQVIITEAISDPVPSSGNLNLDSEDETDDEIFEDSLDTFRTREIAESASQGSSEEGGGGGGSKECLDTVDLTSRPSSSISDEAEFVKNLRNFPEKDYLRAPSRERKLSEPMRRELEDDQILVVSSYTQPETILMTSKPSSPSSQSQDIVRFIDKVVEQVNRDIEKVSARLDHVTSNLDHKTSNPVNVTATLDHMASSLGHVTSSLDHVTARMAGLEMNVQQLNSRMNTLEYLLQIVVSREESWLDRKIRTLTLPFLVCSALLLLRTWYSRRR